MMCDHNESIYAIIPPKPVVQQKPPMYQSQFDGTAPPTASTFHTKGSTVPKVSNISGQLPTKPVPDRQTRGFGKPPGTNKNDATNYMKSFAHTGKVATLSEMKATCPEALQPSELKPRTRWGPPKRGEEPVMNLVTSKNFVVANAVETILSAPKKVSEGAKDYLHKEDYGKVPKYLYHIKQDIEAEYEYIRQLQEERDEAMRAQVRPLDEEERQGLIEGLKAKWEKVNTEFQGGTHLTKLDTIGKIKRKEKYEAELSQIEKDIERMARKNIMVDATQ